MRAKTIREIFTIFISTRFPKRPTYFINASERDVGVLHVSIEALLLTGAEWQWAAYIKWDSAAEAEVIRFAKQGPSGGGSGFTGWHFCPVPVPVSCFGEIAWLVEAHKRWEVYVALPLHSALFATATGLQGAMVLVAWKHFGNWLANIRFPRGRHDRKVAV